MELLNEIRHEEGTAIIMSTHNLQLISLVDNAIVYTCSDGHLTLNS